MAGGWVSGAHFRGPEAHFGGPGGGSEVPLGVLGLTWKVLGAHFGGLGLHFGGSWGSLLGARGPSGIRGYLWVPFFRLWGSFGWFLGVPNRRACAIFIENPYAKRRGLFFVFFLFFYVYFLVSQGL